MQGNLKLGCCNREQRNSLYKTDDKRASGYAVQLKKIKLVQDSINSMLPSMHIGIYRNI